LAVTWENGVEHSGSLCFADTEGAGGSTPPAPTTPRVSRAYADRFVPPMEEDRQREVANGHESVSLFNQGVQLALSDSRPHTVWILISPTLPDHPQSSHSALVRQQPRSSDPCMPSRDSHHEPLRSRPLHQRRKAGAWWFAWPHRAELLRACCANARAPHRRRGAVGTTFISPTEGEKSAHELVDAALPVVVDVLPERGLWVED
jgi:hypothetical protein